MHGRDDRVIPLSTSNRLLDLIPNSQLHVFARCGHWVQIEHAAAFATLVSSFLSGDLSETSRLNLDGVEPLKSNYWSGD